MSRHDLGYLIGMLQRLQDAERRVYTGIESRQVSAAALEEYRLLIAECADLLSRKADSIESAFDALDNALFHAEQEGLRILE